MDPAPARIQGCMERPSLASSLSLLHPWVLGTGGGEKPWWVPVLNHLSIFINMQMSSGTEALPGGVK